MILAALLALATGSAATGSVADAERAFAAAARTDGQWTAFRAFAAPDAILYAPGQVDARGFLAGKPDPQPAVAWAPAHTLTSCDGTLAYSTGGWTRGAARGSFGTVWRRDAAGWRWVYDGGHDNAAAPGGRDDPAAPGGQVNAGSVVEDQASCLVPLATAGTIPEALTNPVLIATLKVGALASLIEAADGTMPLALFLDPASAEGASDDRTLRWRINPIPGGKPGAHLLRVWSWDGRRYRLAVLDASAGG